MKKIYLCFALLIVFVTNAQIINIPDANFKALLLSANPNNSIAQNSNSYIRIDSNFDNEIQLTEAAQVIYLDVRNSNIGSLDGINFFSNIVGINCSNNQIGSLDLTGLPNLEGLDCSYNYSIDELYFSSSANLRRLDCTANALTSLNVCNFTNLTSLYCEGNLLSSLNLCGLTNITHLYCGDNLLTSIDVTGLHNLLTLDCSDNQIGFLNLDLNTNLAWLDCSNNNLNVLDLNGLVNLVYVNCAHNLLSSIDFTGMMNLREFYGNSNQFSSLNFTNLDSMERLDCSYNNLSAINLNGFLPNLRTLKCDNNLLTSIQIIRNNLELLSCKNNALTALNLSIYSLSNLDCSGNFLTTLNLNNTSIGRLLCSHNQLTSIPNYQLNTGYLDCSFNQITSLNLTNSHNLTTLYCQDNELQVLETATLPWYEYLKINCANNQLTLLKILNGVEEFELNFNGNPDLTLICQDSNQVTEVQNLANSYGYTNCVVNSNCSLSGQSFETADEVYLYPNPAVNFLHIQFKEDIKIVSAQIFNIFGALVMQIPNPNQTIDVSGLEAGMYFIKINSEKGTVVSRFVKE
jgi:Leucine-rich repeat (LRR) protein